MSHPLTRRIAQAALVVAAGAVPVVAAGSASAAVNLTKAPELGGLSHLDTMDAGKDVQATTHHLGQEAGPLAGSAVQNGVPLVADTAGKAAGSAVPSVHRATDGLTGHSTGSLGDTAATTGDLTSLTGLTGGATRSLPQRSAPTDGISETAQQLPQSLPPVDGLPLGQVGKVINGGPMTRSVPAVDSPLPQSGLPTDQVQHVVNGLTGGGEQNRLGGAPGLGSLAGGALPTGGLGQVLGGLGTSQLA